MKVHRAQVAMLLAVLIAIVPLTCADTKDNITVTLNPEAAVIIRLENRDVLMTINISNIVDANGTKIVNDFEDFNLTLALKPEDIMLAYPKLTPFVAYDPFLEVINSTITIYAGPTLGKTAINMSMTLTLADGSVFEETFDYSVIILRDEMKTTTQEILDYILVAIGLVLLFLVCCQANVTTLKDSVAWIFGTLLIQAVIVPVCVLILVSLFWVPVPAKVGIMTCAFSPGVLLALAFGVIMEADLTLLAALVFLSALFSFAVMPLWSMQFAHTRNGPDLMLTPADIPYLSIFLYSLICLLVIIAGLLTRHYYQTLASNFKKLTFPVAVIICLFAAFAMFFGGADLLTSVHIRAGVSCFLWAFILAVLVIIGMLSIGGNGMKWRASGILLLVKTPAVTYSVVYNALDDPLRGYAMVGAYFFSLMTLIMALLLLIAYLLLKLLRFKGMGVGGNIDLPNIGVSDEESTPVSGGYTGYRRLGADGEEDEEGGDMISRADALGRSAMKMGAFGAPSVLVWF